MAFTQEGENRDVKSKSQKKLHSSRASLEPSENIGMVFRAIAKDIYVK